MKYNKGQIVQVKSVDFFKNHPNYTEGHYVLIPLTSKRWAFNRTMLNYCNKSVTIGDVEKGYYKLEGTETFHRWQDWMLESRNEKLKKILK